MLTVELLPDEGLDRRTRQAWERLADAGLPSLAAHPHPSNRPHVTLAVAEEFPDLAPAQARLPIQITLAGVLAFGGTRGALVRPVVPTIALLELHAAVWTAGVGAQRRHAPGAWLPHLGFALRMSPQHRAAAVALLADLPDEHATLVAARSYDTVTRVVRELS